MGQGNNGIRGVEERLRRHDRACREMAPQNREDKIAALVRSASACRTRGTLWDFLWEQAGYLGRYCLVWEVLWMTAFCYMLRSARGHAGRIDNEALVLISILPPVLVLLTVEEITKIYQRSMLEIEYAARYSLRQVVLTRMLMLCGSHAVILAACIVGMYEKVGYGVGALMLYGFTPMVLALCALLTCMQRFGGEQLRAVTAGFYALIVVCVLAGNMTLPCRLYDPCYVGGWCAVCAAGVLFGIRQFVCLCRKLDSYERLPL